MNLILEKARLYGFNERQLTEKDFYRICDSEQISVEWTDEDLSWFMTLDRKPYIVLPKKAHGLRLLFKQMHELGHYLCHHGLEPDTAFFHGGGDTKAEFEADTLALIALMPLNAIVTWAPFDGSRYAKRLFAERRRLFFLYGV